MAILLAQPAELEISIGADLTSAGQAKIYKGHASHGVQWYVLMHSQGENWKIWGLILENKVVSVLSPPPESEKPFF